MHSARQNIYRNISEAQVRPWISKFISQHITVNRRKNKIQSVKVVTKIWISTNFTITFHFYCLLRLFMSNFKIIYSYHFTINLNVTTIAAESFVNPKKYIAGISDLATLACQLIWKGILIYRRKIGARCTRPAVQLFKVFTTTADVLMLLMYRCCYACSSTLYTFDSLGCGFEQA